MLEVSSVTWAHLHNNKYAAYQNLSRKIEIHPGQNFTGSRTKKTKFYSRFLLLRINPDSPVHTSANKELIQICLVML